MRRHWLIVEVPNTVLIALFSSLICTDRAVSAVQVKPVIFIQEPVSQLLKVGDPLVLSCQARVAPLVNRNQPLPTVSWLKDKIPVTTSRHDVTLTTNSTNGFAELVVHETNTSWSGTYECIASDAEDEYVTISRKAMITVVSQDIIQVTAYVGQPLFLSCGPSSNHVTLNHVTSSWTFNDQHVNESFILSDGSLFISKITPDHHGSWQCYNTYNITTSFTFTENDSFPKPVAVIDHDLANPPAENNTNIGSCYSSTNTNITIGCTVYLHCQIAGISKQDQYPIQSVSLFLQRNNKTVINVESHEEVPTITYHSVIESFNVADSGLYYCSFNLTIDNSTVTVNSQELTLSVGADYSSKAGSEIVAEDIFLLYGSSDSITLTCGVDSSHFPFSLYWAKNAEIINSTMDDGIGHLTINKETVDNAFAVYQCFIEDMHEIRYSIHRILVKYLCNPPGNLKIKAHTNISNSYLPYLHLSWVPPEQRGGLDAISYLITIFDGPTIISITTSPSSSTNSTNVELQNDATYYISLSIQRPNIQGIKSVCSINTLERFSSASKPFDQLTCTSDGHVLIKWSPLGINPLLNPTENLTIKGACVNRGMMLEFHIHVNVLYDQFEEHVTDGLLPGTLCEFYGQYQFMLQPPSICDSDHNVASETIGEIPRKTCQIQEDQIITAAGGNEDEYMLISLVCGFSEVRIEWAASQEMLCAGGELVDSNRDNDAFLYVFGVCVRQEEILEFNHSINLTSHPFGSVTFDNISVQSICSFDTNSSSLSSQFISPAQCVLDSGTPHTHEFDIYTQHLRNSINCSTFQSSFSTVEGESSSIFHIVKENTSPSTTPVIKNGPYPDDEPNADLSYLSAVIAAVFLIVFIIAAFFVTVSVIIASRRYRRSLKRSWSLNEVDTKNNGQSDLEMRLDNDDASSIKTQVECFIRQTEESRELNDLNIYEGYTIMDNPDRPDTTGSSGYGSEIATQCTIDYHCNKLNEVSEDADNCTCDFSSTCTDSLNGSSDHEESLGQHKFRLGREQEAGCVMCAVCTRGHCVKASSLTRLCPCVIKEGQEYIRLTALDNDKHCDNSKDWLTTSRLSTLSV